jgi:hypothetical protein
MRDTQRPMSDKSLRELTTRAHRLATAVESATKISANAAVRREGARLGEVLEEWLDEIKGLLERQDASAAERLESFEQRLRMAEGKVDGWNVPAAILHAPAARKRNTKASNAVPEVELEIEEKPWYADDMDEIPMSGEGEGPAKTKKGRAA